MSHKWGQENSKKCHLNAPKLAQFQNLPRLDVLDANN
jgi:hypothetical protein